MDFDLSEEQRLLKESVDGLLTDSYDFDARKKYMKEKAAGARRCGASSPNRACSDFPLRKPMAVSVPAASRP